MRGSKGGVGHDERAKAERVDEVQRCAEDLALQDEGAQVCSRGRVSV